MGKLITGLAGGFVILWILLWVSIVAGVAYLIWSYIV